MGIINDEKSLDKVLEKYYYRYNRYNENVLIQLGKTIKEIGEMKPSEVHRLSQQIKYSKNIDDLIKELSDITDKSVQEIKELFDKFAKENTEFSTAYKDAINYTKYEDNIRLQRMIESISNLTSNTMRNITNTSAIGFYYKDTFGNVKFRDLKSTYLNLIDEAVYNVSTGTIDYQSAMRKVLNSLADSGIRTHEDKIGYTSGYSRRLDSSVRQNILEGLRRVNNDIQKQIGEEIGADGIEISAHFPCAFDHLDIQGKRYTKDEFEELNDSLDRPIGTYNCRHFTMQIILDVDEPMYNPSRLYKWRKQSYETFEYEGKKYNAYEATQVQRKIETAIRKQKDRQIIARASGDTDGVRIAQQRITQLTAEYNNFSRVAGLPTYKNRLSVSGYRRVSTK